MNKFIKSSLKGLNNTYIKELNKVGLSKFQGYQLNQFNNFQLFYNKSTSIKYFTQKNNGNNFINKEIKEEEDDEDSIKKNHEYILKPKYELALASYLNNNYEGMTKLLEDLNQEYIETKSNMTLEYINFLFKAIDLNKSVKIFKNNNKYIYNILEVSKKIYREDFDGMRNDLKRIIDYLRENDPKECIKFLDDNEDYFPYFYKEIPIFNKAVSQ